MLEQIFKSALITSCIGTALAGVLTLFRPITKKLFSSRWHYYIWLIVLVTMVLPVRIAIPSGTLPKTIETANTPSVYIGNDVHIPVQNTILTDETGTVQATEAQTNQHNYFEALHLFMESKINIIAIVWLTGMIIFFFIKWISYLILLIKINKNSNIIPCPELSAFTKKKIITRQSDKICSPLMIGIFRPILLLPEIPMTSEQLNNVLAHEMTHFRRKDILYKWFALIVKCIHWFNPAIYLINKQIDIECEISCDLAVVEHMNKTEEMSYINTILTLLSSGKQSSNSLTTGMTGNKHILKRRFIMIKNRFKISKKAAVISVVSAVLILVLTVFTSAFLNSKFIKPSENDSQSINSNEIQSVNPLLTLKTDERQNGNFNFLLLGLDEQGRSDSILLFSFKDGNLTGLSIPRDVMFSNQKLSAVLNEENGDQMAVDAVRNKLSVPITYYAKVNLDAIKDLVDCLGGVEFDVPMNMEYDDPYKNLHIQIQKGRQTLNGEDTCGLLRFIRSNDFMGYENGNLSRIEISQQFIRELVNQKLNVENLNKLPEIYKIISRNVYTNYSPDILTEDIKLFKNIKNVSLYTIPGEQALSQDGSIYEIDFEKAKDILTAYTY